MTFQDSAASSASAESEDGSSFTRDSCLLPFMELMDSLDITEIFYTANTLDQEFSSLYNLPFLKDYVPELACNGKDASIAEAFQRTADNQNIDSKQALLHLNTAIRNSEGNLLGECYAHRAEILKQLGELELASRDAKLALEHLPVEKTTLLDELSSSYDLGKLEVETELQHLRPLDLVSNSRITTVSQALKVEFIPSEGFTYVAQREIIPGEFVLLEDPYSSALYTDKWLTHCYQCTKRVLAGIPCPTCNLIVYCGQTCKDNGMKYHSLECSHMIELCDLGEHDGALLAYRTLIQHPVDEVLQWRNHIQFSQEKERTPESADTKALRNLPDSFDLLTHHSERNPFYKLRAAKNAVFLTKCLQHSGYFMEHKDHEAQLFVGTLLYHFMQSLVCNYFTSSEVVLKGQNPFETQTPRVSTGLYPGGAYFNHSCACNMDHYFINGKLFVRALKVVSPGETATICYGPNFTDKYFSDRQRVLKDLYYFDCMCCACKNGWLAPRNELQLDVDSEPDVCVMDSESEDVDGEVAIPGEDQLFNQHELRPIAGMDCQNASPHQETDFNLANSIWPEYTQQEQLKSQPYLVHGGYKCPFCSQQLPASIHSLEDFLGKSCPGCIKDLDQFIRTVFDVKIIYEDTQEALHGGQKALMQNAIRTAADFIELVQKCVCMPNPEFQGLVCELEKLFHLEAVIDTI